MRKIIATAMSVIFAIAGGAELGHWIFAPETMTTASFVYMEFGIGASVGCAIIAVLGEKSVKSL